MCFDHCEGHDEPAGHSPAPALSPEERATVERFEAAPVLEEAWRADDHAVREAAIRALRELADDLETASHAAGTPGERQGLLTAARFARAKAQAMER